ncbi:uncharacterized protein LOC119669812 [Teleopsis dalmanni]|uniref:uncharacterized protein LOC119669812 n=1 Tax=Teleopsis dalmanni TaxID=139649 RepID=UPI0018CE446E|nr:uncharacterized protein LOC119669812 [Teleopsis dalmanni]
MDRRKKLQEIIEKAKSELRLNAHPFHNKEIVPSLSFTKKNLKKNAEERPIDQDEIVKQNGIDNMITNNLDAIVHRSDVRPTGEVPNDNNVQTSNIVIEKMCNLTEQFAENYEREQEFKNECHKGIRDIKWENVIDVPKEANLNDELFEGTSFANIFKEPSDTDDTFEYKGKLDRAEYLACDKKFSRLLRQEAERKNIQNSQHSRICLNRNCSSDENMLPSRAVLKMFGSYCSSNADASRKGFKPPCGYEKRNTFADTESDSEDDTVIGSHTYSNIVSDSESNIEIQKSEITTVRSKTSREVFLSAAMLKEETHQSRAMTRKYEPFRGVYVPYPSADFERGAFRSPENREPIEKVQATSLLEMMGPIPNESSTMEETSSTATIDVLFKQASGRSSKSAVNIDSPSAANSNRSSVHNFDKTSTSYSLPVDNEAIVAESSSILTDSDTANESQNVSTDTMKSSDWEQKSKKLEKRKRYPK